MNKKETLRRYFREHREEIHVRIVGLVREMVKERTVNVVTEKLPEFPFLKIRGEEYRVAKIVKRELDSMGVFYEEFSRTEGRPNVISRIGKNLNGKRLLMPAHMDIVPAGDGWDSDPFDVVEKDGILIGRGTLDNKGPLASILVSAEVIRKLGIDKELDGEIMIAALSDEEATDPDGTDYGIGYLLDEKLINPTFAIVPDIGGNMKEIDVGEKGRAVYKITAFGKQAHGSTPERGINAVFMMAKMVCEIEKLKFDYHVHPVLGHPSLNLGEIHGGAAPNIVPGTCIIYIDIRTVPGMTKESVVRKIQNCADAVPNGKFTIETQAWSEPHAIDPDNVLVHLIQQNALGVLGFEPKAFGMGGGTFAKELNLSGVTAVGWGPGDDEAFHISNEYISIDQLIDFTLMICLVAVDLLD